MEQKIQYGTRTQLTITLASLADNAWRESNEVDNSSNLFVDVALHGKITTGTSPTADTTITIAAYGSDGTGARPGNVTGSDSAPTVGVESAQFEFLRTIPVDNTSNKTYEFYIGSLAAFFGGVLPKKWGIVVNNDTAVSLNSTGGNHEIFYTPITYTVA